MLQDELIKRDIDWVMDYYPYVNPVPYNSVRLEKMLIGHIMKGSTIAVFPDSDVDGMFSALEIKSLLELLGCKKIKVLKLTAKSHGLNNKFIDQVMDIGADLLITVDSTTNNVAAIEKLSMLGVDHIIIDHHIVSEDIESYPSNVVVVNSKDAHNSGFNNVSAGMLCYIIIHNLLNKIKIGKEQKNSFLNKMYVLGYVTLYTDSMDLKDKYNLSVIQNIEVKRNFAPRIVTQFMSEYDLLCRQFIEYRLGPRINSLIRRERFDVVYDLLFNKHSDSERATLLNITEDIYIDSKEAVAMLSDKIPVNVTQTYVIASLDSFHFNDDFNSVIKNYTGLIANNLATRYKRLGIVIATDKIESYKGSVRDPYIRKTLRLFERFCDCGGHMSAFGFRLYKRDFDSFNSQIDMISDALQDRISESQIVLDGNMFDDRLPYYVRSIAEYNEISGNTLPKAVIRKKIGHSQKVHREEKYSKVSWEGLSIVCFYSARIGDTIDILPTVSKNGVNCYGTKV